MSHIYIISYLLIGLLLVTIKSPIRELVDKEIRKIKIHHMMSESEVPTMRLFLFRLTISAALILIYPIMLFIEIKDRLKRRKAIKEAPCGEPEAHVSWLKNRVSVKDAESRNMVEINGRNIPFGCTHKQWKALLSEMQDGDVLHEFCSPDESWEFLAGSKGIALVRNNKIIADIITEMN